MLRQLSDRQLDVKELLNGLRVREDKSIQDALAGNLGFDDDIVVPVVLTRIEMGSDPGREVGEIDLIWAGEFLDHLATQGYEIRKTHLRTRRQLSRKMQTLRGSLAS